MNRLLQPPEFLLAEQYASAVTTLGLALCWMPVLPISPLIAALALFLGYWAEKVVALRWVEGDRYWVVRLGGDLGWCGWVAGHGDSCTGLTRIHAGVPALAASLPLLTAPVSPWIRCAGGPRTPATCGASSCPQLPCSSACCRWCSCCSCASCTLW